MQEIYDTISELNDMHPKTKVDCISFFNASPYHFKIIDSHNTQSIIVIFKTSINTYALKIECGVDTATHKELEWYKAADTSKLASYCIDGYVFDSLTCIVMQYISELYPLPELLTSQVISINQGLDIINHSFYLDTQLFEASSVKVSTSNQLQQINKKYLSRLKLANNYSYLKELFFQKQLTINNKTYQSPTILLRTIRENPALMNALISPNVGIIHGDLHLGNINVKDNTVILLDPKSTELLPLEYDGGKLLQSTHSNYIQIMLNEFTLEKLNNQSYQLFVDRNSVYESIYQHLRNTWIEEFLIRSLFMEAMHFITMAPHHASNKNEATALYLIGVQRLNEVVRNAI